jgi:hypothetical protein
MQAGLQLGTQRVFVELNDERRRSYRVLVEQDILCPL